MYIGTLVSAAQVLTESSGNPYKVNKHEDAVGCLQIRLIMVEDIRRIAEVETDRYSVVSSLKAYCIFHDNYSSTNNFESFVTLTHAVLMWKNGPQARIELTPSALAYLQRFRKHLLSFKDRNYETPILNAHEAFLTRYCALAPDWMLRRVEEPEDWCNDFADFLSGVIEDGSGLVCTSDRFEPSNHREGGSSSASNGRGSGLDGSMDSSTSANDCGSTPLQSDCTVDGSEKCKTPKGCSCGSESCADLQNPERSGVSCKAGTTDFSRDLQSSGFVSHSDQAQGLDWLELSLWILAPIGALALVWSLWLVLTRILFS
jgi:hypothetical protein